jgi:PKD repeat protein
MVVHALGAWLALNDAANAAVSLSAPAAVAGVGSTVTYTATVDPEPLCDLSAFLLPADVAGWFYTWDVPAGGVLESFLVRNNAYTYGLDAVDGPATLDAEVIAACSYLTLGGLVVVDHDDDLRLTVANANPTIANLRIDGRTGLNAPLGVPVTLRVDVGDPEPADTLTTTWTWSDGTVQTGTSVTRTIYLARTISVTVSVRDDDGGTASVGGVVVFADQAPVITSRAVPDAGVEGSALSLTATATDQTPVLLRWTVSDGTTGVGSPFSWTPLDEGTYTVSVEASSNGLATTEVYAVSIANAAPVAQLGPLDPVDEGVTTTLFSQVSDPGPFDVWSLAWDVGGGFGAPQPAGASAYDTSFPDDGAYTVQARASDTDGGVAVVAAPITVRNVAPAITATSAPTTAVEGTPFALEVTASDVAADPLAYAWTLPGGAVASTARVVLSAPSGAYMADVVVSDGDGGQASTTLAWSVADVAPSLAWSDGEPVLAEEGVPLTLAVTAEDVGGDAIDVVWDFGDGTSALGASTSHAWADDGTYRVRVEAITAEATTRLEAVVVVLNGAPLATLSVTQDPPGSAEVAFSLVAADVAADPLIAAWSFGDGATALDVPAAGASHAYAANGTYTVSVVVSDDDGGAVTRTAEIVVTAVGPSTPVLSLPPTIGEGEDVAASCAAVDQGGSGRIDYTWSYDDGRTDAGASITAAWPQDGTYTLRCTATDARGVSAWTEAVVRVDNLAPRFDGVPPTQIFSGATMQFDSLPADPGILDALTVELTLGPADAVLDPVSGVLTWPVPAVGVVSASFTLVVTDEDGAVGTLGWTVVVEAADTDADGLGDGWESLYGLDPNDAGDAFSDADGDGRTALDEYAAGTRPDLSDAPGLPVLRAPDDGAVSATTTPRFIAEATTLADDAVPSVEVLVARDAAMGDVVAYESMAGVMFDNALAAPLADNRTYFWKARVGDGYGFGPWSEAWRVTVDVVPEAPPTPTLRWPLDGSTVSSLTPTLEADLVVDPEGQDVSYVFTLEVNGVQQAGTVQPGAVWASWTVDPPLADGDAACWRVEAVDTTGLTSLPSAPWCFEVDLTNEPPSAPVIVSPGQGEVWAQPVELVIRPGVDPEARAVTHRVAMVAPVAQDLPALAVGVTDAVLPSLTENAWNTLAVLADDGASTSPWVTAEFLVDSENDPPTSPGLLSPADGSEVPAGAVALTLLGAVDPDDWAGELLHTVYVVQDGVEVAAAEARVDAVGLRADVTLLAGRYVWYVVADDQRGGVTTSASWSFAVGEPGAPVNDRDPGAPLDDPFALDEGVTGCGCHAGARLAGPWSWLLGLAWASRRRARR